MEDRMHERETLDRREFTVAAALLVLGGVTITVSGCGGGGDGPGSPSNPGDRAGTISANHGHTAVITAAQLTAGGAVALDIRGDSDHPHTVSLSSADVAAIAANRRVSRESSNDDGHTHTVTFN
jgi:hypothetical protein